MRQIFERCSPIAEPDDVLELDFDTRERSRMRARARSGEEVGLFLERGTTLRDGDCLRAEDGKVFRVVAKPEPVSFVAIPDGFELARLAYHLGNRHVRLQIGRDPSKNSGFLRYQPDHVLDDLVTKFGLEVLRVSLPFEPEPGAYHSGGHAHSHGHSSHSHDDEGTHDHSHNHDDHGHSHTVGYSPIHSFTPLEPGGLVRRVP